MNKAEVSTKLREHEAELKGLGITRLSLFGSVARGDSNTESDVDLMAEFDAARDYSLLDRMRLENRLADLLGMKVDLTPALLPIGSLRLKLILQNHLDDRDSLIQPGTAGDLVAGASGRTAMDLSKKVSRARTEYRTCCAQNRFADGGSVTTS